MSEIYFASDFHFGHANILKFCPRPHASVEEMNEAVLKDINDTVRENDTLYYLGDFVFCKNKYLEEAKKFRDRINCKRLILLYGNHDKESLGQLFSEAYDYFQLKISGKKYILCHYPIMSWNSNHHGSMHLHGHTHAQLNTFIDSTKLIESKMLDVGIDNLQRLRGSYKPIHIEEVNEFMDNKKGFCPDIKHSELGMYT